MTASARSVTLVAALQSGPSGRPLQTCVPGAGCASAKPLMPALGVPAGTVPSGSVICAVLPATSTIVKAASDSWARLPVGEPSGSVVSVLRTKMIVALAVAAVVNGGPNAPSCVAGPNGSVVPEP